MARGVVGRLLDATVGYVVQKSRGSLFNLPDPVVLVLLFITQKMFRLPFGRLGVTALLLGMMTMTMMIMMIVKVLVLVLNLKVR